MKSICFPPYRLELAEQRLMRGAEEVRLRAKTFAVLCELVARAGELVTKEELLQAVWPGTYVCDVAPMVCVWEIRKALERPGEALVATVHGRGYRFVGQIEPGAPVAPVTEAVAVVPPRFRFCSECDGRRSLAHGGQRRWHSASRVRRSLAAKS
jgi:DNA-binding winged helix-turn-helix (wHTH) protein